MARTPSITIGSVLSHYLILEKLGRGGMGEVWKAENIRLKKIVAIKTLSPQLLADEDAKARFLREARLAAKLDHPNIATVYDIGETEHLIFIVMEYVQGKSLDKQIQCGPMSKREAVEIIVQVCEALSEAHKHRIIHRDIKPQNIMMTPAGRVKVLDFGLAKLLPTPQPEESLETRTVEATALTMPGITFGTRKYMSPEQWLSPEVDETSDIFSLGVVMYEMLVANLPVEGYQLASMISTQSGVWSGVLNSVPTEFRPILTKALAKDRAHRYQAVEELLRDLRSLPRVVEVEREELAPTKVVPETLPLPAPPRLVPTLAQVVIALAPSLALIHAAATMRGHLLGAAYVLLALIIPFMIFWVERLLRSRVKLLKRLVDSTDARVSGFVLVNVLLMLAAALNIQDFLGLQDWGDWRYHYNRATASKDIVLIAIDAESRQRFLATDPGANDLKHWRKYHSQLIENILKHGPPKAIGFDLYFEDETEFDSDLARAITNAKDQGVPVIIGQKYVDPQQQFLPTAGKIKGAVGETIGHAEVLTGKDDIVRSVPLVMRRKEVADDVGVIRLEDYPSMALLMLSRGKFDLASLIPGHEIRLEDRTILLDDSVPYVKNQSAERFEYENLLINFPRDQFVALKYSDVFEGSIFNDGLPRNYFLGKHVLIGSAYEGFETPAQIPLDQTVYRYEIHAMAMNTILQNSYIRRIAGLPALLVIICSSLAVFSSMLIGPKGKLSYLVPIGVCALLFGGSYWLFASSLRWFDSSYAVFGAILVGLLTRLRRRGMSNKG